MPAPTLSLGVTWWERDQACEKHFACRPTALSPFTLLKEFAPV